MNQPSDPEGQRRGQGSRDPPVSTNAFYREPEVLSKETLILPGRQNSEMQFQNSASVPTLGSKCRQMLVIDRGLPSEDVCWMTHGT